MAIPSCAFPGFPAEPVHEMADATVAMLQRYGLGDARKVDVPGGYPAVYGELAGPPGSPTVMMYAHYDVQPAPKEQNWATDPFAPTRKDGRIFGRGAADDKSGIAVHAGHGAGARREASGEPQDHRRGRGGDGQPPRRLRLREQGDVPGGRLHRRRHGQPGAGRAGRHIDASRSRARHRHGQDARSPAALRRVRRRRARRARRPDPHARDAARG